MLPAANQHLLRINKTPFHGREWLQGSEWCFPPRIPESPPTSHRRPIQTLALHYLTPWQPVAVPPAASFERCAQALRRCQSISRELCARSRPAGRDGARWGHWQRDCREREALLQALRQLEISPPAVEICLGEDHRIKAKALKPRKKLFQSLSVGCAALGTMFAMSNRSYKKPKVSIASAEPGLTPPAALAGAPGAWPSHPQPHLAGTGGLQHKYWLSPARR